MNNWDEQRCSDFRDKSIQLKSKKLFRQNFSNFILINRYHHGTRPQSFT